MPQERTYEQVAEARGLSEGLALELRRTRGMTTEALERIPDQKLRRTIRKLNFPDLPRARERFRVRESIGAAGEQPPADALGNALRQLDSSRARGPAPDTIAGVPAAREVTPRGLVAPTAGLGPGAAGGWVALGPGNIGGRTRAIVVHPKKTKTVWAGSVGGGVWRTDDGGKGWSPVDDFMANLAVTAIVIDPTNPNVLYAGTGEGFSNIDALRGFGAFRTTDGVHWQQIASTTGFRAINRLAISRDAKTLLAATPSGLFRSVDPNRTTWTKVIAAGVADVKFHPTDNAQAVAGGLNDGMAYVSTDAGATWKPATHGAQVWSGRVELTYAVKDPTRVYASVQMTSGQIWRSTNGGKSYTRMKALDDGRASAYLGEQGWYDNVIWAGDPTDANFVIVGGIDLHRSTDGGDTLQPMSTWWHPASAHADHHCIVADPGYNGTTNKRVYFGNDGGIYTTADVRTAGNKLTAQGARVNGWTELKNTYGVTQFYGGAGHAGTGVIVGGAQDNGTLIYRPAAGSEQWTEMFGGDGGWCAADPTDPKVFYGEYVTLNIHRSLDGGKSADFISGMTDNGWKPVPFRIPDAMTGNALFIAPFALDPNAPNRLLAGGVSLWRTDDAKTPNTAATGPAWRSIKPSVGTLISALAIAAGNSNLVWVGHEDGMVFKSTNASATTPVWRKVDHTGAQPLSVNRYCTGITIDASDNDNVYVTFAGYNRGNLWATGDGGTTWRNLGQALPEAPVRALAVHPDHSDFLYAGTEVGLFASEDGGATWSPTNEGPTNCSVDDLFWMNRVLICVTHGRGMFKIDLAHAGKKAGAKRTAPRKAAAKKAAPKRTGVKRAAGKKAGAKKAAPMKR